MSKRLNLTVGQLRVSPRNVRKSGPGDVSELAATIASVGIIHPLKVVVAAATTRSRVTHEIVAGSRRFAAVKQLIKAKKLPRDYRLPCDQISAEEAEEISLIENLERAEMHPADEFEAFQALIDKGESITGIAARFGIGEGLVTRRLKLARVAPEIVQAFRRGEIELGQVMAYAVNDDQERQQAVFAAVPLSSPVWKIKERMTEGAIPATDKRARFVGLEAYRKAGGTCYADLFAREEDKVYLTDGPLLDRLVAEKLEAARITLAAEGWRWTDIAVDGLDFADYPRRVYPVQMPLSGADQARLDDLTQRHDELAEAVENAPDDEALADDYERLSDEIDAIQASATAYWSEDIARCGAAVCLAADGNLRLERGLIRKETPRRKRRKHVRMPSCNRISAVR